MPRKIHSFYKNYMTEDQFNRRKEFLRRMNKRIRTIGRKQSRAEKECYAEYVYWKGELEATMKRMRQFICR